MQISLKFSWIKNIRHLIKQLNNTFLPKQQELVGLLIASASIEVSGISNY